MFTLRAALVAVAVASTAATAVTAATVRAERPELAADRACAEAVWPMLPAECLQGAGRQKVRYALAGEATGTAMAERFGVAFAGDLVQPPRPSAEPQMNAKVRNRSAAVALNTRKSM